MRVSHVITEPAVMISRPKKNIITVKSMYDVINSVNLNIYKDYKKMNNLLKIYLCLKRPILIQNIMIIKLSANLKTEKLHKRSQSVLKYCKHRNQKALLALMK